MRPNVIRQLGQVPFVADGPEGFPLCGVHCGSRAGRLTGLCYRTRMGAGPPPRSKNPRQALTSPGVRVLLWTVSLDGGIAWQVDRRSASDFELARTDPLRSGCEDPVRARTRRRFERYPFVQYLTEEYHLSSHEADARLARQPANVSFAKSTPVVTLCRGGGNSGTKCGEIRQTFVSPSHTNNTYLLETTFCSTGGDSGGPYYSRYASNRPGGRAYAIHVDSSEDTGCVSGEYSYGSHIAYVERDLRVKVNLG